MARELFFPLPGAHGAILCAGTTFPLTTYFAAGWAISIIRCGSEGGQLESIACDMSIEREQCNEQKWRCWVGMQTLT